VGHAYGTPPVSFSPVIHGPSNADQAVAAPHQETISQPFGDSPAVSLKVTYRDFHDNPSIEELNLAFQMLDSLLLSAPFEQWKQ
jgi:hypothetical protein